MRDDVALATTGLDSSTFDSLSMSCSARGNEILINKDLFLRCLQQVLVLAAHIDLKKGVSAGDQAVKKSIFLTGNLPPT